MDALRRDYHQAQLLSHPGIVNVFDFDHDGDIYFVIMELLDGESLGALIRQMQPNKLPLETAIRILRELGDAVAYAHDRGVRHLDLKPDNVMVDAEGHVRLLDFGLAHTHISAGDFREGSVGCGGRPWRMRAANGWSRSRRMSETIFSAFPALPTSS